MSYLLTRNGILTNKYYFVKFFLFISCFLSASELETKLGQLFVVPICPTHGEKNIASVHNLLSEREIGGIIFMAGNSMQQRELAQTLQNQLSIPLLTFQDAEWGVGMRLADIPPLPKNLTLGAVQDLRLLGAYGRELARQCRLNGVLGDFAPVCDVNTNPDNPVIGIRAFGDEMEEVGKRARAVFMGMREGGLLASAKHFPGHGDTHIDSHHALPIIEEMQLPPFQCLVDAGVDMVMVGHLLCTSISALPSSLSPEIIEGVLRGEMGFDGVIVTDSLVMKALSGYGSIGQICEKALLAGNDLLLFSTANEELALWLIETGIPEAIDYLKEVIPEELIDQKIKRIDRLRYRELPPIPEEREGLTREIFRAAITQVGEVPQMGAHVALVRHSEDPTFERFLSAGANVTVFAPHELEEASAYEYLLIEQVKGDPKLDLPPHAVVCLFDVPYALSHKLQRLPSGRVSGQAIGILPPSQREGEGILGRKNFSVLSNCRRRCRGG